MPTRGLRIATPISSAIDHRKAATQRPSQASLMTKTNSIITANEKTGWTTSDADAPPMTLKTARPSDYGGFGAHRRFDS